jgi:hypothetical protein
LVGAGDGGVIGTLGLKLSLAPVKVTAAAAAASVAAAAAALKASDSEVQASDIAAPESVMVAERAYHLKKLFYDVAGGDLVVSREELLAGLEVRHLQALACSFPFSSARCECEPIYCIGGCPMTLCSPLRPLPHKAAVPSCLWGLPCLNN